MRVRVELVSPRHDALLYKSVFRGGHRPVLERKHRQAARAAPLEICVSARSVVQRIARSDFDAHGSVLDGAEERAGGGDVFVAVGDPGDQGGPSDGDGFTEQALQREGLDLPGGGTEVDCHSLWPHAVEGAHEGVAPDRVVDDGDPAAFGDLLHARDEILAAVDDRVVAAVRGGDARLLVAADGSDDGGAEGLAPLTQDPADAAGGG